MRLKRDELPSYVFVGTVRVITSFRRMLEAEEVVEDGAFILYFGKMDVEDVIAYLYTIPKSCVLSK